MGSKKRRNRQPEADAAPAAPPGRSRWPMAAVVLAVVAAAVAWALAGGTGAPAPAPAASATAGPPAAATPAPPEPLPAHVPADDELPPLPYVGFQPPRPPDVVQAVYRFAAQHPEVMRYVPCYCGCERSGHAHNEDCFVSARDANGQVTWNTHGMG